MQRIQKTIAEFVSGGPLPSAGPDDKVSLAIVTMKSTRSDCVLVIESDKLIGIFTERDFLLRVAAEQREPAATRLRDVMTAEPETLAMSDCISYAINRMATRGYRNVPIVDPDGRAVAVVDVRDIIDHLADLFAEIGESGGGELDREWVDIGGGS